jgi:hypothetical protein
MKKEVCETDDKRKEKTKESIHKEAVKKESIYRKKLQLLLIDNSELLLKYSKNVGRHHLKKCVTEIQYCIPIREEGMMGNWS